MKKPEYKKIILDVDDVNQLSDCLSIALENTAPHAKPDVIRFIEKIIKQLESQKLKHKGKL